MSKHRTTKKRHPAAKKDPLARLGAAVRGRRRELGISQEQLAQRAGMHRTYIADLERHARNPTLRTLAKLAEALEVDLRDLVS